MTEFSSGSGPASERLVTGVDAYRDALLSGQRVRVAKLCGRIIRGSRPSDFETLTDDPNRRVVMLMGPDGLELLPGKTGYEMLTAIGYTREHIADRVSKEKQFKLAVFLEGDTARPATWDNVIDLMGEAYPGARGALGEHRLGLQTTPFATIEASAGFSFEEVDHVGSEHARFMTYERFLASAQSLPDTRAFLHHTGHFRELFAGDGYTRDHEGNKGMQEYVVLNRPLQELGSHALIDIEVALPPVV